MFNFMKKDKQQQSSSSSGNDEKSGKKKDEKKKEKKDKKKDRSLTTEDLNRLEEVRRSYFGRKIKKKKEETSPTGVEQDDSSTASISPACSPNNEQNNHKNVSSLFGTSENKGESGTVSSGGPVLSSIDGGVITLMSSYSSNLQNNQAAPGQQKRPAVPPKPPQRGILKGASNYYSVGVKTNIDDEESVMENTQANETIIYDVPSVRNGLGRPLPPLPQMRTSSPADVSTSSEYSSAAQSPMRSPNMSNSISSGEGHGETGFEVGECVGDRRCLKNYALIAGSDLELPPIQTARQPKERTLVVSRQLSGDFGFCLRRAFADPLAPSTLNLDTSGVKRKEVLFAEPKEFHRSNPTGLLPGDQLLQVNGRLVSDMMSREEVADLIRTSGETVTLLVKPVPELKELTVRLSCDGTEVELDEGHIKTGTLTRSGSRRFKKGDSFMEMDLESPKLVAQALRAMLRQKNFSTPEAENIIWDQSKAKTEVQLASEKAWLEDQKVWLVHQSGYSAAKLLISNEKGESQLGKAKVKLEQNGQLVDVEEEDIEKANPSQLDQVEDLAQLRYLNESSVIHALRQRYASSLIHTYAGNSSMIIINPMRPLSIYTDKVIQMFRGCKRDDMPPHIYSVAQSAYRNMITSRIDQSVILMGRSGSGKTDNFKNILTYLCQTVGSVNKLFTMEKLKAIFILLESFGNCRTKLNSNATRFTLIFSLDFDHSGQIANSSLQAFMLDRSRLIGKENRKINDVDENYKIFKYMLNGVDDKLRKELYLDQMTAPNLFFGPQTKEDMQHSSFCWARTLSSLELLGVKVEDIKAIWNVLAAIYHLGVAGVDSGMNGKGQFKFPQSAQRAASLLGTTIEQLARSIFHSTNNSSNMSNGSTLGPPNRNAFRTSPTEKGQNSEKPVDAFEALQGTVMGLYFEVFNAVISLINKSISSNTRTSNSILIIDTPGFQNPATVESSAAANFEDLCHNYIQERLQLLFHDHVIVAQHDKYTQEKIEYSQDVADDNSPIAIVNFIDKPSQQGLMRSSNLDLRNADQKGLLWLLDEEAIFPGSNDESFLERLFIHNCNSNGLLFKSHRPKHFAVSHLQGTNLVLYNADGWLKSCRENVNIRSAILLLQESQKNNISRLFVSSRGPVSMTISGSVVGIEGTMSLRRASSIRRVFTTGTASIKRKSLCLQVKFQVDGIIETLRRTRLHFIHCILPQHSGGLCSDVKTFHAKTPSSPEDFALNIPLLRSQISATQILDAVRLNKQGFPDHILYAEFRRRFELLGPSNVRDSPVLDEKKAVETLIDNLDIDKTQYKLGLSQIFFRTGALVQLEEQRDERLQDTVVKFQAYCRGYLSRKKLAKRKVQELAIRCIQRNVRKFMAVRSWPWWRLLIRVLPLLDVHRTEAELKAKSEELETLRHKVEKLERERNELKHENNKLEAKVSELTADLAEEHATSTHASEMLEAESSERMKMEKEIQETNNRYMELQRLQERMELEVMEFRMMKASTEINGDLSGDEEIENSVYKQRYDNTRRELELIKKKMKQQIEDDEEQMLLTKKTIERKVHEAVEEAEIQRQSVAQWKRKVQRLNQDMNDIKFMLEEQTARNASLEKKQRKFDADLSATLDQVRMEKLSKEKLQKEKDQILGERYTLEQELESVKLELEMKTEKLSALTRELDDLTFGNKGDEEIAQLKRAKHEMELKLKDQEEELDDLAGQVSMLEQAKLRLEMIFENVRKEHRKELSQKDEEMEETRASCQKKLKLLEHQLETEHEDRQTLIREKHELERKFFEAQERPMINQDAETVSRLRKDLKRTKALFKDAQLMLERNKGDSGSKATIRQLKNQLEDAEFAKVAAIKSKQGVELELQETSSQLDDVVKTKAELEKKVSILSREKHDLQAHLEENEEELAEVMRKYKASVNQLSLDQTQLGELASQISDLEVERNMLRDQLTDLSGKLEQLEGETVSSHEQKRLEMKVKEMETRLELEATTRGRLEIQLNRVRETLEKLVEECDGLRLKEQQAQEANRKWQRQLRDMKEDYAVLQQKELEVSQRKHETEFAMESLESELQTARSDLKLALKRIEDLQAAMEDNAESEESEGDSDGDSSDTSVESFLLSQQASRPSLSRSRLTSSGNSSLYSSSTFGRTSSLGEVDVVSRLNLDEIGESSEQPQQRKVKLNSENQNSMEFSNNQSEV